MLQRFAPGAAQRISVPGAAETVSPCPCAAKVGGGIEQTSATAPSRRRRKRYRRRRKMGNSGDMQRYSLPVIPPTGFPLVRCFALFLTLLCISGLELHRRTFPRTKRRVSHHGVRIRMAATRVRKSSLYL